MFGGTVEELLFFGRQFGFALTGAAALWGFVFWRLHHRDKRKEQCLVFGWVAEKLLALLAIGVFIGTAAFGLLQFSEPVFAHEGITLVSESVISRAALQLMTQFYWLWIAVFAGGFTLWGIKRKAFLKKLGFFYAAMFALSFSVLSVPVWTGSVDFSQIFFAGHSVHSIFTLGTVIVLDFLIIVSQYSHVLKQHIFPLFPTISKVIWVGLAIDFLSVLLVFEDAIEFTPKFFFMQTVIGILIVNGVFLVGPLTRKMLASVTEKGEVISSRWMMLASLSGVISICSWSFNTFVDSFHALTLSYWQFSLVYVGLVATVFIGHAVVEHFTKPAPYF